MTKIVHLPSNLITKEDQQKLESFGAHTIMHGRATRWKWNENDAGDEVFEIYRGGREETLAVRIDRERKLDVFNARDAAGNLIVSGDLEHVFAELETHFARLHHEFPDPPA